MPEEAPPKWAPNPYAIAQLLVGESNEQLLKADGATVDDFLRKALLRTNADTVSGVFRQFQVLAEQSDRPEPMAEKFKQPLIGVMVRLYGQERVQRLLYYLLPITDAVFERLTAPDLASGNVTMAVDAWYEDADRLVLTDTSYRDPVQGSIADCYLIASMIALAWIKSDVFSARLQGAGFNPPTERSFAWQFHNDRGADIGGSAVSARIPVTGNLPRYARSATQGEYWPSLIEKAFVRQLRPAPPGAGEPTPADYQSIDRGVTPQRACQMLVGGEVKGAFLQLQSVQEIFFSPGRELAAASGIVSRPVVAWTQPNEDPQFWDQTGLWPNHAYALLGFMSSGHVVLRNPHGVATGLRPGWSDEEQWAPDGRAAVTLNQEGVFALSQQVFLEHFKSVGWVEHGQRGVQQ